MPKTEEIISQLRNLVTENKRITTIIERIRKVPFGEGVEDAQLGRIHKSLAGKEGYGHTAERLAELRKQLKDERNRERSIVLQSFMQNNNGLSRGTSGFTIEPFDFSQNNQQKLKISFCNETVINWTTFTTENDLEKLYERAKKILRDYEVPLPKLASAFSTAYRFCEKNDELNSSGRVKIPDFHKYLRMGLIHEQLITNPEKDFTTWQSSLPGFAYLHNISRYLTHKSEIDEKDTFVIFTGSQVETVDFGVSLRLGKGQDAQKYTHIGKGN